MSLPAHCDAHLYTRSVLLKRNGQAGRKNGREVKNFRKDTLSILYFSLILVIKTFLTCLLFTTKSVRPLVLTMLLMGGARTLVV
ncbi:unnamed protein product [Meloidogyne enterolobii]|uniref:Uncharacterized protein n=1 Tax=Meloidogyne enterolobii TaxID=390850 RepID=A0ACB0YNP1_MELEN